MEQIHGLPFTAGLVCCAKLPVSRAHGVLTSQRCLSLEESISFERDRAAAEDGEDHRLLRVRDVLGHDAPGAVGELIEAPELLGCTPVKDDCAVSSALSVAVRARSVPAIVILK